MNGTGDKEWIDVHVQKPEQPTNISKSNPQRITVRAFDAMSKAGMELLGKPVPPGTPNPEFDFLASLCCYTAYEHLKVGNTWLAPIECEIDPATNVPLKVYKTSEEYGL